MRPQHVIEETRNGKGSKAKLDDLRRDLGALQRRALELKAPIVIVLEGMDIWGMGRNVNQIARGLDPRGFDIVFTQKPTQHEKERAFISRFFELMPARGHISLFDRSWYFWLVHECYHNEDKRRTSRCLKSVHMLERHHALEGWTIIKFYFDTNKKELKRRFRDHDPKDPCRGEFHPVGEEFVKDYDEVVDIWKDVLRETDTPYAPWEWVWKENEDDAILDVLSRIKVRLEASLACAPSRAAVTGTRYDFRTSTGSGMSVERADLRRTISIESYREILPKLQERLGSLQCRMYKARIPTIIAFEGWDAAGKGGNILRLTSSLNPRGYQVVPVGAPKEEEKTHHHLWRFFRRFPKDGHITIFDRTWYGRVLVERVENLTPEQQWSMAYGEINDMEEMLTDHGTVLIKFWLQIDKREQLRRFQLRQEDPQKNWKITSEDWRNREKWENYMPAIEEMIERTSTDNAPWTIVPSNDKRFARLYVLQKVIEAMEESLEEESTVWPDCLSQVSEPA